MDLDRKDITFFALVQMLCKKEYYFGLLELHETE